MPAAAVIPAPRAYTNIAAVKTLVVCHWAAGLPGEPFSLHGAQCVRLWWWWWWWMWLWDVVVVGVVVVGGVAEGAQHDDDDDERAFGGFFWGLVLGPATLGVYPLGLVGHHPPHSPVFARRRRRRRAPRSSASPPPASLPLSQQHPSPFLPTPPHHTPAPARCAVGDWVQKNPGGMSLRPTLSIRGERTESPTIRVLLPTSTLQWVPRRLRPERARGRTALHGGWGPSRAP